MASDEQEAAPPGADAWRSGEEELAAFRAVGPAAPGSAAGILERSGLEERRARIA